MIAIETQDKQFHDGNGTTELGTILPAWWLNQVQDELLAVVQATQIAPNKATTNQLLAAIKAIAGDFVTARGNDFCPSGMVMIFSGDTAPAGWLKANGAAVSRTAYAKLFAAIGTRFGAGDGYSTFNLPDLRGEFPRFWDDGRGVDSGRVFGSVQSDNTRRHIHGTGMMSDTDDAVLISQEWGGQPAEGRRFCHHTNQRHARQPAGKPLRQSRPPPQQYIPPPARHGGKRSPARCPQRDPPAQRCFVGVYQNLI